jgi:hypothetical protein
VANEGTLDELLKHVTKASHFVDIPEVVGVFLRSMRSSQLVRAYGKCRSRRLTPAQRFALPYLLARLSLNLPLSEKPRCPYGGSANVHGLDEAVEIERVYYDAWSVKMFRGPPP